MKHLQQQRHAFLQIIFANTHSNKLGFSIITYFSIMTLWINHTILGVYRYTGPLFINYYDIVLHILQFIQGQTVQAINTLFQHLIQQNVERKFTEKPLTVAGFALVARFI